MHRPEPRRDAALPDLLHSGCARSRSAWLSGQYEQEAGSSEPHGSIRMASFSDQQEHPEGKRRSGRTSESGLQQHPRRSRMHHSEATRVLFAFIADLDPRLHDAASSLLWSIENGDGTRPSQEGGKVRLLLLRSTPVPAMTTAVLYGILPPERREVSWYSRQKPIQSAALPDILPAARQSRMVTAISGRVLPTGMSTRMRKR